MAKVVEAIARGPACPLAGPRGSYVRHAILLICSMFLTKAFADSLVQSVPVSGRRTNSKLTRGKKVAEGHRPAPNEGVDAGSSLCLWPATV